MTKSELVQLIINDISASGSLPLDKVINKAEIERIIDVEKKVTFRDWRESCEVKYNVIMPAAFKTPEFKSSRAIQMPPEVYGINDLREIKDGARIFGINDPDIGLDRVFASDLFLSPFSSDILVGRTISWSFYDLSRSFSLIYIQHHFNINTHRLQILGRDPSEPILIQAYVAIADESLFENYDFQRWCIAKTKTQLHRILKTFNYSAIGGITITDSLMQEGQEELKEIKEKKAGEDPADWFIMVQ